MANGWRVLPLIALAAMVLAPPPAAAQEPAAELVVVAAPGAWLTTYATPLVALPPGSNLTFHNADVMRHDVVSEAYGPDTQPWCGSFREGQCPLFWTPLIGLGKQAAVLGLENLAPGTVYWYYCTTHPPMVGAIAAVGADA